MSRSAFLDGVRDSLPAMPANLPFGVIAGIAAIEVGFSPVQTVVMSALLFAGAAQLAAIELVGRGAPLAVVVVTALVVNLRYVMYSASIAPYFRRFAARWKALLSFFLLDLNYALAVAEYREGRDADRHWYFLGASLPLYLTWVSATAMGVVLGTGVPEELGLDFAVPLLFMALLFPVLEDRGSVVAALVAGGGALLVIGLPFNLGLVVAAVVGVLAGLVTEVAA